MPNRLQGRNPSWFSLHSFRFRRIGLRGKLLIALVPVVVLILICTGLLTYRVSEEYISIALERNVILRDRAMARELELFLDNARRELLFFATGKTDPENIRAEFERLVDLGGSPYYEFGYISANGDKNTHLVQIGRKVVDVSPQSAVNPSPALYLDQLKTLSPGQVQITGVLEVQSPVPEAGMKNRLVSRQVVRLYTATSEPGVMYLSIPAAALRNILSVYNSDKSPLWAFPRSNELRYAYVVDTDGWILFQSEPLDQNKAPLATFTARTGYEGTLGRPGHESAFRPSEGHTRFWDIVEKLRKGEFGKTRVNGDASLLTTTSGHYLAYAPILFRSDGTTPEVYAGLVYIDRSLLPIVAGYKYLDIMAIFSIATIIFITLFIYFMGRILTDPIRALVQWMESFQSPEDLQEIHLGYHGRDIEMLCSSINKIIMLARKQLVEIRQKDEAILSVNKREKAAMEMHEAALDESRMSLIPEIVGAGPVVAELKANILKAAQTDVDVLIVGETGTGKQLVAEAIHKLSKRKDGPFISINCGALDENLLLDALFGHVKGAFTEARTDRNGAFVEADGGALFLDEIQVASPKVQQALLRALSMRKIKPLGSDKEIDANVRIIAATNANLSEMIEKNLFREDLYYRLKVLSIQTPPLRSHPESIPILALCYLRQAETLVNRTGLGFSNGAIHKLATYGWPGNIRELVNCVTRAAVMADSDVIQPEEIRLEGDEAQGEAANAPSIPSSEAFEAPPANGEPELAEPTAKGRADTAPPPPPRETPAKDSRSGGKEAQASLNERQLTAWRLLLEKGSITRSEYQNAAGGMPSRTAIHDLQSMIQLGLVIKTGKGPATRYILPPGEKERK